MRRVTLFDSSLLDARVGVFRRGPVIDWETQQQIGTARTIWYATSFAFGALGFWLRDADGRVVVRVIRGWNRRWNRLAYASWTVLGGDGEEVGSIVSALRETKRGRLVRKTSHLAGPRGWEGSVLLDNEEAATIQGGVVTDPATQRQLAAISRTVGRGPDVWRLSISDRVDGPLRIMVLAWLGVAFDLQRYEDAANQA